MAGDGGKGAASIGSPATGADDSRNDAVGSAGLAAACGRLAVEGADPGLGQDEAHLAGGGVVTGELRDHGADLFVAGGE